MTQNTSVRPKPTMLMILDGFGLNPSEYGNAVKAAHTPNLDKIFETYPHISLRASGLAVGLPEGQMGNSEVGHLNIGAGRIVYQELTRITKAIEDGIFSGNAALNKAIDHVLGENSTLHIFGLLSDGGVHSHIEHIKSAIRLADSRGVSNIMLHCFMDGRDVPPTSGIHYIEEMAKMSESLSSLKIGVVSGRYYAMDRDKRWERVEKAYDALTLLDGRHADSASEAVKNAYAEGETDEFILPTVCEKATPVSDGDSVIFCNFRPDRAREITRAFVDPGFDGFARKKAPQDLVYVCMTQYDASMPNVEIAFPPQTIKNTLGEYLSANGLHQLRIAETEKYAHVTFFFNGGVEEPNKNEDRILVKSPAVATYDLQPEMSAPEVSEKLNAAILGGEYDVIIINFANPDMVGHTGIIPAAIQAVETVDKCVGAAVEAIDKVDGVLFICADHGNAEQMINYETGAPHTAHTTNPVPFILYNYGEDVELREGGCLADIAPTLLEVMGLPQPKEMTGKSLIVRK